VASGKAEVQASTKSVLKLFEPRLLTTGKLNFLSTALLRKMVMKIVIDLRAPTESDCVDTSNLVRELETQSINREQNVSSDVRERNEGKECYQSVQSSFISQTPIYDFFMRAAGKELGSEEEILRSHSPRRELGGSKWAF
jgi:hypothetical protein